MKKEILFILVIAGLVCSCKKKSENSNSNPTIGITGIEILKQTVPPSGGTLTVENFTLVVPPGTFSESTTLTISRLDKTPFGSNAKTPVYFINNLPIITGQEMTVTLSGLNVNDSLTTFFAEPNFVESICTTQVGYWQISHTIENGNVKVIIPVFPSSVEKSVSQGESLQIGVVSIDELGHIYSSNNHFELHFDPSYYNQVTQLATYLEDAYCMYSSAPFSLDFSRRSWPVEVFIHHFDNPDIYGFQANSILGNSFGFMEFNKDKLNEMPEMRVTAGHEFLHMVQSWYDPRNSWSKAKSAASFLWLDEACAVWVEERFADQGYISSTRHGNERAPFEAGLSQLRTNEDAQNFGYGMSGAIKYIVNNYGGESMIKKIWGYIYVGDDAAEAILNAMNIQYQDWYGNMIIDYSQGKIYSDVISNILVAGNTSIFHARSMADSVTTFTASYLPLASKIYVLDIQASAVNDQTGLSITANMNGYQKISLYRYKLGSSVEFLGQSAESVSVPGLKDMINSGYKFIAIFTNLNYSGSNSAETQLSFTARLKNKKTYTYKLISFSLTPACHVNKYDNNGVFLSSDDESGGGNGIVDSTTFVQNGNILTGSFTGGYESGTITVTINPDNTLSYIVTGYSFNTGWGVLTMNCSVSNLPFIDDTGNENDWGAIESYPYVTSFSETYTLNTGYYDTYQLYENTQLDEGTFVGLTYTTGSSKSIDHLQIHKHIIPEGKK